MNIHFGHICFFIVSYHHETFQENILRKRKFWTKTRESAGNKSFSKNIHYCHSAFMMVPSDH